MARLHHGVRGKRQPPGPHRPPVPLLARRRLLGPGPKRRRGPHGSHAVGEISQIPPAGLEFPKTHQGAGGKRETNGPDAGGGCAGVGGLKPCAQCLCVLKSAYIMHITTNGENDVRGTPSEEAYQPVS